MSVRCIYQMYLRNFTPEGTIKAAMKMLGHIKGLGFDTIYLTAMQAADESPEGLSPRQLASGTGNVKNPYRIKDYFAVDEEYGTMEDLKEFVKEAHKLDLKVLIDLVYLHCGKTAVFIEENPDFVIRDESGGIKTGDEWPFARFNYNNPEMREYLWSNMEFYIRDIKADGFRCDVADNIPLDFWVEGVKRVKKINPDVYMLNEGSSSKSLCCFDTLYMFDLIHTLLNVFICEKNCKRKVIYSHLADGAEYTADSYVQVWKEAHKTIPVGATLNDVENHDTVSDMGIYKLECTIGNDGMEAVMALIFTLDGIPMIYNGCEVADEGEKNMFWNRFCKDNMSIYWENALTPEGRRRMELIKELVRIRNANSAINSGKLEWIEHNCRESVLAYSREDDCDKVKVYVNVTCESRDVDYNSDGDEKIILKNNASIESNKIKLLPYGYVIFSVN